MTDILKSSNIFFDTAVSAAFQYQLVHEIGLPKDHVIYATDYPYTNREDTQTHLHGYDGPKQSGQYTDEELNVNIVRENALKYLFPRLAGEYDMIRK